MILSLTPFVKLNYKLIITTLLLLIVGLLVQYSTAGGVITPWALHQASIILLTLPLVIIIACTPTQTFMKGVPFLFLISCLLLFLVMFLGVKAMGATRWLRLGNFNLQPSELIKIAVILFLGFYFENIGNYKENSILVWIPPILIITLPVILILKQPNLGTATVLSIISIAIMFSMGFPKKWIIYIFCSIILLIPLLWRYLYSYQKRRILTFLDPSHDPFNAGYNLLQSKIAIGSGGVWGKGFLEGTQTQLKFLPEKHSDFVFTVIAEEGGFITASIIIALYFILILESLLISERCPHRYGKVVAVGIATLFFTHMFINIGMVMGILPVVGVPLPFISYGGSITLTSLLGIAFLFNIDMYSKQKINKLEYL